MRLGFDAKRLFHNATGLGNYSRDLLRILARFYPEHQYLLFHPKPKSIDWLPLTGNMSEHLPKKFWHRKFKSLWRSKYIVPTLKSSKIDIYHGLSGELPIGIEKTNIKTVVTIHDLIFMRYPAYYSFFDRKIHFLKFRRAARIADKVVAISEQTKRDIIEFLKIPQEKITVIYQGCHEAFKNTHHQKDLNTFAEQKKLPKNFVLYVGTIEPRKNLLALIKALHQTDIPLVVVGKRTAYFKEVQTFIAANEMASQVLFFEGLTMNDLSKLYALATIFCYPSQFEGFGIPIIEALYSGTPVITSKGGCFPEAGGKHSCYINPENAEAIKTAVQSLWNDPIKRKEMAAKGKVHAQRFEDEKIAEAYFNLYKGL